MRFILNIAEQRAHVQCHGIQFGSTKPTKQTRFALKFYSHNDSTILFDNYAVYVSFRARAPDSDYELTEP